MSVPRGECHLHLQGAVPLPALRDLWDKKGWQAPLDACPPRIMQILRGAPHLEPFLATPCPETLQNIFSYPDFEGFLASYVLTLPVIQDAHDLEVLGSAALQALHVAGYAWTELTVALPEYILLGLTLEETLAVFRQISASSPVKVLWTLDPIRNLGPTAASALLEDVLKQPDFFRAVTLGGNELAFPAWEFHPFYERARDHGLRTTIHVGETGSARDVLDALVSLPLDRIGHGIQAIHSEEAVSELCNLAIPLEVCVSSNLRTHVVQAVEDHPLKVLSEAGVAFTINSDDPILFQTTLENELGLAAALTGRDIETLLKQNFNFSFLTHSERETLLQTQK